MFQLNRQLVRNWSAADLHRRIGGWLMSSGSPAILQVSASDRMGGAEKVAHSLFEGIRQRGGESWMAVGEKTGDDASVFAIENDAARSVWSRVMARASRGLTPINDLRGVKRMQAMLADSIGQPDRTRRRERGEEDFDCRATRTLLNLPPRRPDLMHCHNLHSPRPYFDLRELPSLCEAAAVLLTLHDAWLLSGHCAHSFECERWKTGCGNCPDLSIYPAINADSTAFNWERKRDLLARCKLFVATPSRWLMDKVRESILAPAMIEGRVIENGVDLKVFKPGDRLAARAALGLDHRAKVLLFAANGIRQNCFKDFETMRAALKMVGNSAGAGNVVFIALGEAAREERMGSALIRFVPFESDPAKVAQYYQAADVYVHAARADTFPTTVLEAMACERAVVASTVGGIVEQVEHGTSGLLTPVGDAGAMAAAMIKLLGNEPLRNAMGERALDIARDRFDVELQIDRYLAWYGDIISSRVGCAVQ